MHKTIRMKRYLGYMLAACLLTPLGLQAQRSNVRAADRLLQSDKPNYSEIRRLLKLASEHDETKNDPQVYYLQGVVDHNLYRAELRKVTTPGLSGDTTQMFTNLVNELSGWGRVSDLERQPDSLTGRMTLRYLKRVQDQLHEDAPKMYEGGLFWLERKKYAEAVKSFRAALHAREIMLPVGQTKLPADSTTANIAYYALVSAYTGQLYPEVIELGRQYKDVAANKNEVYQFLSRAYLAQKDTLSAQPLLEEGIRLYPQTSYYFGTLIGLYQAQGRYQEAEKLVDEALKITPDNPNLLVLRGNIYFVAQDWDRAMQIYRQILRKQSDNYDALFNLGQVYYNKAVLLLNKPLSSRLDERRAKEFFRQSLPQLEAAYKINPAPVRDLLANVYYRLGMENKYAELQNETK